MLLLAVLCVVGAAAARPGNQYGLDHFDENDLTDQFQRYELHDQANCPDQVNTCFREMHQAVNVCMQKWKQQAGPRFEHCVNNDQVVKNSSRDWQVPSFKWHKAMDQCLAGNEAPSHEALQSLAIQAAAVSFYSRKKRGAPASEDVASCWRDARQKKEQCKQTAMQCTKFAHCFGEGPEPTTEAAKRWFNYVKRMRTETKQKSKIHMMHMGHCLRNEPHTSGDHGDHHGIHSEHRLWR